MQISLGMGIKSPVKPRRILKPANMAALKTLATTTAMPGDWIDLQGGIFDDNGTLNIQRNGTRTDPITLYNGTVRRAPGGPTCNITGSYWDFRFVHFTEGSKVVQVRSPYHHFYRCRFTQAGDELVKCYSGSSYTTFEECTWDTAGLVQPDIGEALYLGEHPASVLVQVGNFRVIGGTMQNFTAEGIDIKEGVDGVLVSGLTIDASDQDGASFAGYSGIACKGINQVIRNVHITNPRVAGVVILASANTGLWDVPPTGSITGLRVASNDERASFTIEDRTDDAVFTYSDNEWE